MLPLQSLGEEWEHDSIILHLLALWASTLLSASMDTSTLRYKAVSITSANSPDVAISPKVAGEGDNCDEGGEPEPPVHPCLLPCRGLAVLHVSCAVFRVSSQLWQCCCYGPQNPRYQAGIWTNMAVMEAATQRDQSCCLIRILPAPEKGLR